LTAPSTDPFRLPLFSLTTPAPPHTSTLSLHDALPISRGAPAGDHPPRHQAAERAGRAHRRRAAAPGGDGLRPGAPARRWARQAEDRKSTRLNSSHVKISYAVFCLKKKKKQQQEAK